jgi:hypothetical protein
VSPTLPPAEETPRLAQIGTWFLLAGVGGGVKYVSTVIRSPVRVSNRHFLALLSANIFISSFCGLMGGLLMTTLTQDSTWTYLASGLSGYLGTQSLDVVMLALKRKIEPGLPMSAVIPVPPSVENQ